MKYWSLFACCFFFIVTAVKADTYPEVIFDNSLIGGSYAKSMVTYKGNSWVENVKKHLPVSDTLFFTPGNALSLKYFDAIDGSWEADIFYSRQKFFYQISNKDVLTLKIYVQSQATTLDNLPKLIVKQGYKESLPIKMDSYIDDFTTNSWINVEIPVKDIKNITEGTISAVSFRNEGGSNQNHQLFIDQIEFLPERHPDVKLSSPAILSKAMAYDRQVLLNWQLPLTPSIRYIKIYRSTDKENFEPVAVRPIHMQGCLDRVPEVDKTYYYKIAWVDYNYIESPFSEVKEVKTKKMSDEELMDVVQAAHVNYFVENFDFNSGMYLPYRRKDKAIVSVKESGYAILTLLIGAERKQISRQAVLGRIDKMVNFLEQAQQKDGVFPELFDGRTGLPEYRNQKPKYNLTSTASIIEALLVARQYFFKEDVPEEVVLREKITKIWERVNWKAFSFNSDGVVLWDSWSSVDSTQRSYLLGGFNSSMNAYLLGLSSPTFPLSSQAYNSGYANIHLHGGQLPTYFSQFVVTDSLSTDSISDENTLKDTSAIIWSRSMISDTTKFGLDTKIPELGVPLVDVYRMFFTIAPHGRKDQFIDYEQQVRNLIYIAKRKDNEMGVGTAQSDIWGYYHSRNETNGTRINPAVGTSAVFVDKEVGLKAMKVLYEKYGDVLLTEYGFRAWLDLKDNDVSDEYVAINQAAVAIMMENGRSGLIWKLYSEIPEIKRTQESLLKKD
ncbi:glucoamylase family protein [Sphingobacterium sp. SYP-B4668]|uniref:glucoamylase family protein n=1 Tax=Sphingobacterium sp. SYP-B4668 TaxID=2996035 RepID=UPI0022DCFF3B|nr:glucoamylase family protein [Sphingobacterium sp. SYP-B4668]